MASPQKKHPPPSISNTDLAVPGNRDGRVMPVRKVLHLKWLPFQIQNFCRGHLSRHRRDIRNARKGGYKFQAMQVSHAAQQKLEAIICSSTPKYTVSFTVSHK